LVPLAATHDSANAHLRSSRIHRSSVHHCLHRALLAEVKLAISVGCHSPSVVRSSGIVTTACTVALGQPQLLLVGSGYTPLLTRAGMGTG
jgi:hypothetical protein